MSAYNFQPRFAPKIVDGSKLHTIRADRKDGRVPQIGERFFAYTGMRSLNCRKIMESTVTNVQRVRIRRDNGRFSVSIDEYVLACEERWKLSVNDGFGRLEEFIAWFEKSHRISIVPFNGWLITWDRARVIVEGGQILNFTRRVESVVLPENNQIIKATMQGYMAGLADREATNPYHYHEASCWSWQFGLLQGRKHRIHCELKNNPNYVPPCS